MLSRALGVQEGQIDNSGVRLGWLDLDGQGVDVPVHQVAECIVNHPVAGHRVFAGEGRGGDGQPEVLAARSGTGVTGVEGAVVDQLELRRGKHGEALLDLVGQAHGRVFRKGLTVQRVNTPVVM